MRHIPSFVASAMLVACGARGPLAEHVDAYCGRLEAALIDAEAGARRAPAAEPQVLGLGRWPEVYDRFVFCLDARDAADDERDRLRGEFRASVERLNERGGHADGARLEALGVLRRIMHGINGLPLRN